ncbi:MAG: single-stranded DNA-binding protein, partial [Clostridiales bacterium]|nr:single-stranded DNA-binding protein [Clostridiales bacterium]
QFIGRLTRDAEIKYSQSTQPIAVTRFSVAVNRKFIIYIKILVIQLD